MIYDIIIVGGGPSGLTAALYGARAGKSVLVLEKAAFGGQITWSPCVENFPTLGKVSGNEFADRLTAQVLDLGVELELDEVLSASKTDTGFSVRTAFSPQGYESRSLILAVGAKPRSLGLPEEERYIGSGISFCAVCDGAFYKGKNVAVVGGGNTALQDAVLLSDLCRRVYIIHRRSTFRGEEKLVDTLHSRENVEFLTDTSVSALHGDEALSCVTLKTPAGERTLELDGLFVAVGHEPDSRAFAQLLALDDDGYALAGEDCAAAIPGLYAAGDFRQKPLRQLTTAVADGTCAALGACRHLEE